MDIVLCAPTGGGVQIRWPGLFRVVNPPSMEAWICKLSRCAGKKDVFAHAKRPGQCLIPQNFSWGRLQYLHEYENQYAFFSAHKISGVKGREADIGATVA